MADLRATPMANPIMGLLADRLKKVQEFGAKPFGYENPPVEMLMNLLGVPAVQQTMERMAYGEPLTTGRGMTTKPRPEAVEAAMTLLPMAAGAAKATKGLPVGASIESVGNKNVNVSLNEASNFLSAKSKFGEVGGTIRQPDKLSDKPYLQINYAEVEEANRGTGKGKELYKALIDEAESRGLRVFSDSTVEKAAVNVYKSLGKGGYKLKDMTKGSLDDGAVYGAGAEKPAFEISNKKSSYPQQEALDTAQRNAALPIEEGGLGLPKDNTPEMRAQAMGFVDAYHGTTQGARKEQLRNSELWATDNPKVANTYATGRPEFGRPEGQTVMPLSVRLENPMVIDAPYGASWRQIDTALPNDPEVLPYSTDMLSDIAKKQGYDSLIVKNVFDVGGGRIPKSQKGQDALTGTTYAVFDPAQVRSRYAAFDPMRKNEKDILAGVLPLGLLADEDQRKKLYELMPSLLGQ